jgi:hypothetical protein
MDAAADRPVWWIVLCPEAVTLIVAPSALCDPVALDHDPERGSSALVNGSVVAGDLLAPASHQSWTVAPSPRSTAIAYARCASRVPGAERLHHRRRRAVKDSAEAMPSHLAYGEHRVAAADS